MNGMSDSICMCGASAGYPHRGDCPFPYFGMSKRKCDEWLAAQERIHESYRKLILADRALARDIREAGM